MHARHQTSAQKSDRFASRNQTGSYRKSMPHFRGPRKSNFGFYELYLLTFTHFFTFFHFFLIFESSIDQVSEAEALCLPKVLRVLRNRFCGMSARGPVFEVPQTLGKQREFGLNLGRFYGPGTTVRAGEKRVPGTVFRVLGQCGRAQECPVRTGNSPVPRRRNQGLSLVSPGLQGGKNGSGTRFQPPGTRHKTVPGTVFGSLQGSQFRGFPGPRAHP